MRPLRTAMRKKTGNTITTTITTPPTTTTTTITTTTINRMLTTTKLRSMKYVRTCTRSAPGATRTSTLTAPSQSRPSTPSPSLKKISHAVLSKPSSWAPTTRWVLSILAATTMPIPRPRVSTTPMPRVDDSRTACTLKSTAIMSPR